MMSDVELKKSDAICRNCMTPIWIDLIFKYRVSIQNLLPEGIKRRPNCWWGKECRTQTHNPAHSKHYNHICEQSRK